MNNINDVFNWLQSTGIVAFLIAVIPASYKLVKPVLKHKEQTEKNAHVKQAMELGLSLSDAIVPEMAVMAGLSKTDRKQEAVRFVHKKLSDRGLDLDLDTIAALVERAYQSYKVAGGDNHEPKITPAPTEVMTPDEGGEDDD